MRILAIAALASLVLAGCQSAPPKDKKPEKEPVSDTLAQTGEWQASALSEQSIRKINALNVKYQQCLQEETDAQANLAADPRAIGDSILHRCEETLNGIRSVMEAEGVPDAISARYLRKNRSQGAQNVMRAVQFVQARRAAEQETRRAAPSVSYPP
jgi:hypothetical protein